MQAFTLTLTGLPFTNAVDFTNPFVVATMSVLPLFDSCGGRTFSSMIILPFFTFTFILFLFLVDARMGG